MEQVLNQFIALAGILDVRNAYMSHEVVRALRNHGFYVHRSYTRPPRPPPPPPRPMCPSSTRAGTQCKNRCALGHTTCLIHRNVTERVVRPVQQQCTGMTRSGVQCKCPKFQGLDICWRHAKKAGLLPPPPEVPTECSICYSELSESPCVKTACGHYFHASCFETWRSTRSPVTCPMCRKVRPRVFPVHAAS